MTMPREGESTVDWFNRWRAEQHQPPIPERITGEDGKAETHLRTFQLSDVAWHGLMALALDFGYVKGTTNNPNVTKLIEVIGQGKILLASAYGGPGSSAPSLDE